MDDDLGPDDWLHEPMSPQALRDGVVVIGPLNIAVALTADAAEQSGRRLIVAAAAARNHKRPAANE